MQWSATVNHITHNFLCIPSGIYFRQSLKKSLAEATVLFSGKLTKFLFWLSSYLEIISACLQKNWREGFFNLVMRHTLKITPFPADFSLTVTMWQMTLGRWLDGNYGVCPMYLSFTSAYDKNISCMTFESIMGFFCFHKVYFYYYYLIEYRQAFTKRSLTMMTIYAQHFLRLFICSLDLHSKDK